MLQVQGYMFYPDYSGFISGLTHYRPSDAVRRTEKLFTLEDLFSSVLLQFKKYHPSGNLKYNNLGISKLKIA